MLKSYACDPDKSHGRLFNEAAASHRSPFQRDRDRIIHSTAFRRLKHKTQVFIAHEGDHYRTRLTHTIEVAQVARTISKALGLNIELSEAVALAHDLGHTAFGHIGEDTLAKCMAPYGGFDHNAQAIKIVTELEQCYADFNGLNLTWETLEGIAKHNGPLMKKLPFALAEYNEKHNLDVHSHASAEAQVAALSDDIAYNNHDLDDGLRAGLFQTQDIQNLPIIDECFNVVDKAYTSLHPDRRRHEVLRRVFGIMVDDVINESQKRLNAASLSSVEELRHFGVPLIQFSEKIYIGLKEIRQFLFKNMYRSPRINEMRAKSEEIIRGLFTAFMERNDLLPAQWQQPEKNKIIKARKLGDYLAGMTDSYALLKWKELNL